MVLKEAIEILQKQLLELDGIEHKKLSNWTSQTLSWYSDFFGASSEEYKYLSSHSYVDTSYLSVQQIQFETNKLSDKLKDKIHKDIDTLTKKGLPIIIKQPKVNWLYSMNKANLLTGSIFIAGALFIGGTLWGKYLSDVQNIELRSDKKKLEEKLESLSKPSVAEKTFTEPKSDSAKKDSINQ